MSAVAARSLPPKFARRSNPFSTRYVRPGAIPFVFADDCDALSLIALWQSHGRRGAIVGPHGSGKSTLLAALAPALEQAGERVLRINLHDGQRRLPQDVFEAVEAQEASTIVVDGYEQLGWLNRKRTRGFCARNQLGLLVTCHREVQLPVLFRTAVDASLAERIVAGLMPQIDPEITSDDVRCACRLHGENLREALFALYDLYEQRVGLAASPSGKFRTS